MVTKESVKSYLSSGAQALGLLSLWMWGPLQFLKPWLAGMSALLAAMANDDVIDERAADLINGGTVALPHGLKALPAHQVALLEDQHDEHLAAFKDAVPDSAC